MQNIAFHANGQPTETVVGTRVVDFLISKNLSPNAVLVEKNGTVLLRDEMDKIPIEPGDRLEIFRVSAGG